MVEGAESLFEFVGDLLEAALDWLLSADGKRRDFGDDDAFRGYADSLYHERPPEPPPPDLN